MIVAILKVAKIQGRRYRKDIFAYITNPNASLIIENFRTDTQRY